MDSDDFPRGEGDPDFYGYDNEHEPTCKRRETGRGSDCDCSYPNYEPKEGSDESNSSK